MLIKTSDLINAPLDWVVTKLEMLRRESLGESTKPWWREQVMAGDRYESYGSEWEWGGPIIERERITLLDPETYGGWRGRKWVEEQDEPGTVDCYGPTPLIAAMRCYCYAKLGDEVEIPPELQLCQQPKT